MTPYEVYIFAWVAQFADLQTRQAAADDYDCVRVKPLGSSDALSAFCRGRMSYATSIDYYQIGMLLRRLGRTKSEALQQFPNLLAFVLIDLAP